MKTNFYIIETEKEKIIYKLNEFSTINTENKKQYLAMLIYDNWVDEGLIDSYYVGVKTKNRLLKTGYRMVSTIDFIDQFKYEYKKHN